MKEIVLTEEQEWWLWSHGGRTIAHVCIEGNTLYVLMGLAGGGFDKVKLP